MAAECLEFLREKMWDREHGGYYFMVTREGNIVDSTKQLNPMSYVMEGLAEYAVAFHDQKAAQEAMGKTAFMSSTSMLTIINMVDIESPSRSIGSLFPTTRMAPTALDRSDENPTIGT